MLTATNDYGNAPIIFRTGGTTSAGWTSGSERARIDSSGRLLVGTTSSSAEARFIVQGGATAAGGGMNIQRSVDTAASGSTIGFINFTNSSNNVGATISADGDGTWSAGTSHPTILKFSTTADGASTPTERMRIDSSGNINIDSGTVYVDAVNNRFGIGTQSPLAKLHVKVGTNENLWVGSLGGSGAGVYIGAVNDSTSLNVPLQIGNSSITTFATQGVERARIDSSGNLLVGTTSNDHGVKLVVRDSSGLRSAAYIGNMWIGQVINSINNNSELILLHRLGQGQGLQFSGDCIINSWTGSAFISMIVTTYFITDAVQWSVSQATSTISKTTIQLVTATYNSQSWLCFLKAGGGTGVAYFNAFVESNAHSHGGIRAVTSGYTVTTTHATLN
jgi:hypothetical protein